MNSKISGKYKVNSEILGVTSTTGTTSRNYDMQNFDRAMAVISVQGTFSTVMVDLMESSGATVAGTSAAGGKAGFQIGGNATNISSTAGGVRQILLTHSADTTSEPMTFAIGESGNKTFTYTSSTALLNSTAWTSTNFYYGSTVGSSANTGSQLAVDSLKTALASTRGFGNIFTFSTPATNTLVVTLDDSATGCLGFNNTASSVVPTVNVLQAVAAFDIQAEDLNSTANKRWISVKCSTATTACDVGITVIRESRYNPPDFGGKLSS